MREREKKKQKPGVAVEGFDSSFAFPLSPFTHFRLISSASIHGPTSIGTIAKLRLAKIVFFKYCISNISIIDLDWVLSIHSLEESLFPFLIRDRGVCSFLQINSSLKINLKITKRHSSRKLPILNYVPKSKTIIHVGEYSSLFISVSP